MCTLSPTFALMFACGGDAVTPEPPTSGASPNPVPAVASISPDHVGAGSTSVTVTINGTGFVQQSLVFSGNSQRPTTYVSPTELRTLLSNAETASSGILDLRVVNSVPGGGTSNPAHFEVRTSRLEVSPRDSTVHVGKTYQLRINGSAIGDSALLESVSFTVVGESLTIEPGGIVRGMDFGRAAIIVQSGQLIDTVHVSVVPEGTLAAWWQPGISHEPGILRTFQTDGSMMETVAVPESACGASFGVEWHPSGEYMVLAVATAAVACYYPRIYTVGAGRLPERFLWDTDEIEGEAWPLFDASGEWLYFTGRIEGQSSEIWRSAGGGPAERIGEEASHWFDSDDYAAPSPDDVHLLYVSNRPLRDYFTIRIMDLRDRAVDDSFIEGTAPRWSPQGDRIAFWNDETYFVATSDLTDVVELASSRFSSNRADPPSWSPDGEWVALVTPDPNTSAPLYGRLALVNVSTGMLLPLSWSSHMTNPSWRRDSHQIGSNQLRR